MERFVRGDIVVLPFPFSDLSSFKKRPALIIANTHGDDFILAQITSQEKQDKYCIELNNLLKVNSFIRINKLFTSDKALILYKIAKLNKAKLKEVENSIIKMFRV
jgi:mRNA interferase MazF